MKCPVDNTTLVMTERSGVEIDYCPECRGVWLDRGELDKILERAAREAAPAAHQPEPGHHYDENNHEGDRSHRQYDGHDRGFDGQKKRRGSFIGDIFGGFGDD